MLGYLVRDNTFFGQRFMFPDIDSVWNFNDLDETARNIHSKIASTTTDPSGLQSLELTIQLGHVQGLQGRTQEAQLTLDSAKIRIGELGAGASLRPEIRYLLESGRLACLLRTPDQAQARFGRAWELAMENGEDFFAIDAALMLAITQPPKLQAAWLERAIHVALETTIMESKKWLPQIYLRRGWAFFDLFNFEIALVDFEAAVSGLATDNSDLRLSAEWGVARTYRALRRTDEALAVQQKLLQRVDTETFQGLGRGYVLWEIAECFLSLKKLGDAQNYFAQALLEFSTKDAFKNSNPADFSRIQHLGDKKYAGERSE